MPVDLNTRDFSYHVQIKHKISNVHLCGGTIIGDSYILSAAHCFLIINVILQNPSEYQVVVGSIYLNGHDGVEHDLLEYYIPSEYNSTTEANDIAVIKVSEIFTIPVCEVATFIFTQNLLLL